MVQSQWVRVKDARAVSRSVALFPVITSGTPIANTVPGEPAKEDNPTVGSDVHPRAAWEEAAAALAARGVNVSVVRLPQVHDSVSQGLITPAIQLYRKRGACVCVGDGLSRFPAGHVLDVARLYRLAIEVAQPNAKYHAVAEEGVSMRAIAEAVGRRLGLPVKSIAPEEAQDFFGPLAMFVTLDMPASSRQTREKLGWEPVGPGLIADLEQLRVHDLSITRPRSSRWAMIAIDLFPQLKRLAWNRPGKRTIAEPEALALYERNWDLVDREAMDEVDYESIAMWTGHGEALRITSHNVYYVKSMLATDKGVVGRICRRPAFSVP